ncbi:hypothetical protein [Emticicia sp. 17c]|uniref:hypothetical protein n=1 Tax=Emticicia sp. 17c TaxID=3127704 RepID=UPI00301D6CE5
MSVQINNIENLTVAQIKSLVNQGGKFVYFPYTVSIIVMTFQRNSDIYFIRPGESSLKHSGGYIAANLLLGWWGIPWGPIHTLGAAFSHIRGGKDITGEVMTHLIQNDPDAATNTYNIPDNNSTAPQNGPSNYNIPGSNNSSNSPYNIQ